MMANPKREQLFHEQISSRKSGYQQAYMISTQILTVHTFVSNKVIKSKKI